MSLTLSRRACLGALVSAAGAHAARAEGVIADAAGLQADAALFARAYTALHPGLLRYQSAAEAQARFAVLRREFDRPTTRAEAYLAFSRVTAAVRCGHSFLNPANQEGPGLALISDSRDRLPFRFAWLGGRMVVLDGRGSHPALTPGAEVLSIGGVSCRTLLRDLRPLVPADGANDARRIRSLDVRGEENWPLFDVLLPMLRPEAVAGGTARLQVRPSGSGSVRSFEVPLLTRAERVRGTLPGVTNGGDEPAWRMERLADGSGWLAMPTWAVFDRKWNWRTVLESDLDQLAADRAPGLVIDLRGNVGGLDVGAVILSRLVDRDTPRPPERQLTRYRHTPADLDPHLKTWDRRFRDWGEAAAGPDPQGFYALARDPDDEEGGLIRPRGRRFRGRVVVLTDAANSSATFGFAELIKLRGLGVLVGQATGGSRRGINGGAFFFLQLPNSGLEVDVPLIGYYPTTPQPDAGVAPDLAITVTAGDVALGRDPQRLAALAQVHF